MEIEDIICEKVARMIAMCRIEDNDDWNSLNDMRSDLEKETEEVKLNKELRKVIRKLLNEK